MSKRMKETKVNLKWKIIIGIVIAVCLIAIIGFIIYIAPNYRKSSLEGKTNLIINNNNVTEKLKHDIYMDENNVIFLSFDDIQNYFDKYIEYNDSSKRLITTYEDKLAVMIAGENTMNVNGKEEALESSIFEKDGELYLPFSEMSKKVYNAELEYIPETKKIVVTSDGREVKEVTANKKMNLKYKPTSFSRTLEKIEEYENLTYISESENWVKVRVKNGKIGYVKRKEVSNPEIVQEAKKDETRIDGKVNLFWDYFSISADAPNRSGEKYEGVNVVAPTFFTLVKDGDGEVRDNVGQAGEEYIKWAKENGYEIWAVVSNTDERNMMETTSKIMNDYELRENLIHNIVTLAEKYDIDGINIDFENMKKEDKDLFSRFIIELTPRLKHLGKTVSVDVTAPDGSDTWSLCFDRNVIGHVADYLIFMAYDQHGNGTDAGTTAGYDWVELNVKKFLNQEGVDFDKIILGIPLYTRLWREKDGEVTSRTVSIKDISEVLPDNVTPTWNEELKQYYIEYEDNGQICKMWLEEETSIREKIKLANEYKLAGIAFWEKDREPEGEEFWKQVSDELHQENS